tara:strand:- start:849 stop:1094 length:246 start_codon:yes stop_codon:yes gene_type:complete
MFKKFITITWPNGKKSKVISGSDWLVEASKAGIDIPTGCLGGSCGACEIEVNGEIIRACITKVEFNNTNNLYVEFSYDPYW